MEKGRIDFEDPTFRENKQRCENAVIAALDDVVVIDEGYRVLLRERDDLLQTIEVIRAENAAAVETIYAFAAELDKHGVEIPIGLPPLDMLIFCPACQKQHIDAPEPDICKCGHPKDPEHYILSDKAFNCTIVDCDCTEFRLAWDNPPHVSHQCHFCKGPDGKPLKFRLADFPTNGVAEIKTRGKDDTWPPEGK